MKSALATILGIALILSTTGCLCNPCGHGYYRGSTYCAPGVVPGVSYDECANAGECEAGCGETEICGVGCPTYGYGCFYATHECGRCLMTLAQATGEIAVGAVTLPIALIGNICNLGTCGLYGGCGCSSEVYYGDNYIGNGCDPCQMGGGCGNGYNPGCSRCGGRIEDGIQPVYEEEAAPSLSSYNNRMVTKPIQSPRRLQSVPAMQNSVRPGYAQQASYHR